MPDGTRTDFSKETVARDTGNALIKRLNAMGGIPDDELRRYVHHPDFYLRRLAARNTVGFKPNYMYDIGGDKVRPELVHEFLKSRDPRVRYAIVSALVDGVATRRRGRPKMWRPRRRYEASASRPRSSSL